MLVYKHMAPMMLQQNAVSAPVWRQLRSSTAAASEVKCALPAMPLSVVGSEYQRVSQDSLTSSSVFMADMCKTAGCSSMTFPGCVSAVRQSML